MGHAAYWLLFGILYWHPLILVKSLEFIWRLGTRRFHLQVPNLPMSCSDFTKCHWDTKNSGDSDCHQGDMPAVLKMAGFIFYSSIFVRKILLIWWLCSSPSSLFLFQSMFSYAMKHYCNYTNYVLHLYRGIPLTTMLACLSVLSSSTSLRGLEFYEYKYNYFTASYLHVRRMEPIQVLNGLQHSLWKYFVVLTLLIVMPLYLICNKTTTLVCLVHCTCISYISSLASMGPNFSIVK